MVNNGVNILPTAKKTLKFPALPHKNGELICYSPGNSKEENDSIAKAIEDHLNQIEFLDNSQIYTEDYEIEDEDLPSLTILSSNGELEQVKISPEGKILKTNGQENWWKNFTILNHRKF